jgi:hypothetical protein
METSPQGGIGEAKGVSLGKQYLDNRSKALKGRHWMVPPFQDFELSFESL